MGRLIAIALLFTGATLYAATPDPCSVRSTVDDANVAITIKNGRTTFREGEIIPLELSFTSTADKRYWAANRTYDRSGRLDIETYCLEPAARDPLDDYFNGIYFGGGIGSDQQLSGVPFTATAELNEWRQPKPGHYRLYVVSNRTFRPPDPKEATPYGRVAVPLRSNTIEFDVTSADPDWRASQLLEATSTYQSANGSQQKEAARRLRFLNTAESTETLARLFWSLNDQPGGWDLMFGLHGSPDRADAIVAMQREISDPGHPITRDFLGALTKLQSVAAPVPKPASKFSNADAQEYWHKVQARDRELMTAALQATSAALPKKAGSARTLTLQTLTESSDLLSAKAAAEMRSELIAAWHDLPEKSRFQLIQSRWPAIAGPDMMPILKEFVSASPPPARTEAAMVRDAALQHIFDLDPAEGRTFIARDVHNPRAQPALALVKLLSADELRPLIQEAVERIEKNEARELDYHLLELYGDASASAPAERVFNDHLGKWACEQQSAMLRYFLRVDVPFGKQAVEASLAARKITGCYHFLLQELGKSLPQVNELAIRALDDTDLQLAADAALALGRFGSPAAEAALWARLKRFHERWKERDGELRQTPDFNSPVGRAFSLESNLIHSIATGTNWISGPEKLDQLLPLVSPAQKPQIANWRKPWEQGPSSIMASWQPEDHVTFGVLQYTNLDEEQFRAKLSQLPRGTRLQFPINKPGQIFPHVAVEKQEAVFQGFRTHALQFDVIIEEMVMP